MQSILIYSKNVQKAKQELDKISKELGIDKLDRTFFDFEKAVGIQDVREIQNKIYLNPFRSKIKAIIIDATTGITIEAQNALLKTLEEPPQDTIIIVLSSNLDELLPTILSRCKIIEIKNKFEQNSSVSQYIDTLISGNIGDRLKLAQDLSKDLPAGRQAKMEVLEFLEDSILILRKDLLSNYKRIKLLQRFYAIIKTTNVNLRLALENLFLNL